MRVIKTTTRFTSFRMDMNVHRELKTLLASKEVSIQEWLNDVIVEALNREKDHIANAGKPI